MMRTLSFAVSFVINFDLGTNSMNSKLTGEGAAAAVDDDDVKK